MLSIIQIACDYIFTKIINGNSFGKVIIEQQEVVINENNKEIKIPCGMIQNLWVIEHKRYTYIIIELINNKIIDLKCYNHRDIL